MRYDLLHPKALRTALLEAGVEGVPTERQVRRWVTGDTPMPAWARRAIDGVLEHKEEAAPHIGERLDELLVLTRAIAEATPGLDLAAIEDIHRRVLELERARRRPDAPRRSEDQATQDDKSGIGR